MSGTTIRQNYRKTDLYSQLVDDQGVFDTYVDLFVFAASVGHANNQYDSTTYTGDDDTSAEMLWMHFSDKDLYRAVAMSIAYQHHQSPDALLDPELQLETMAKYASGGIDILASEFGDVKGDSTDVVLNYIQDYDEEDNTEQRQTVLGEIVSSFDDEIYGQQES